MKNRVLQKLAVLHELIDDDDRVDPALEDGLNYLLTHQRERLEGELRLTNAEIAAHERRFGMGSKEFLRRYETGGIEDTGDMLEWFALLSLEVGTRRKLDLIGQVLLPAPHASD